MVLRILKGLLNKENNGVISTSYSGNVKILNTKRNATVPNLDTPFRRIQNF